VLLQREKKAFDPTDAPRTRLGRQMHAGRHRLGIRAVRKLRRQWKVFGVSCEIQPERYHLSAHQLLNPINLIERERELLFHNRGQRTIATRLAGAPTFINFGMESAVRFATSVVATISRLS